MLMSWSAIFEHFELFEVSIVSLLFVCMEVVVEEVLVLLSSSSLLIVKLSRAGVLIMYIIKSSMN